MPADGPGHRRYPCHDYSAGGGRYLPFPLRGEVLLLLQVCPHREDVEWEEEGGNVKNGNRYLAWAFVEAAFLSMKDIAQDSRVLQEEGRQDPHSMVAVKTIASKLARACYYILRDGVHTRRRCSFAEMGKTVRYCKRWLKPVS